MRVANLIVLPDGPDMNGSAADAMAGGDYDGDKAAFCLLKGRAFCPAARTPSTIPPMKENTLAGCATTCVRDMISNGNQIDDACAALFSTHEQGIKGRLTIPYFNAVTWRGATDPLTVKTAWYALRAMGCVKPTRSSPSSPARRAPCPSTGTVCEVAQRVFCSRERVLSLLQCSKSVPAISDIVAVVHVRSRYSGRSGKDSTLFRES